MAEDQFTLLLVISKRQNNINHKTKFCEISYSNIEIKPDGMLTSTSIYFCVWSSKESGFC